MLVLTRRLGEAFCIGRDTIVRVSAIEGGRVRIGIEAPRDVRVLREECVSSVEWREIVAATRGVVV